MRISKTISFDAAHYLDVESDARPYARMHGHSFELAATLEGEPAPDTGWVADLGDLADALEEIRRDLDHHLLNEIEGLGRPTLENICVYAANRLKLRFPGLAEVRVSRPSCGEVCTLSVK